MSSSSALEDQRRIAEHYRHEAEHFRQEAAALQARIELYERLFGPESDWVSGTRLLIEAYRQSADERERLAQEHLQVLDGHEVARQ